MTTLLSAAIANTVVNGLEHTKQVIAEVFKINDMKIAEEVFDEVIGIDNFSPEAVLQAMTAYAEQFKPKWVSVETPPEPKSNGYGTMVCKAVLVYCNGTKIAYHFPDRFKEVNFEDWDDFDINDYPYMEEDTEKGMVFLKKGWYEELYNYIDDYSFWQPCSPTHWQPLPAKP